MGNRGDEFLVRLSSDTAQRNWRQLYKLADHVTRFDVQLTMRVKCEVDQLVHQIFREAGRHTKRMKKGPSVTLIRNVMGGNSVYLGKRTSEAYGRAYNKHVESGSDVFAGCVRLEVEFKGRLAVLVSRRIAAARFEHEAVAQEVFAFFQQRGCTFSRLHDSLDNSLHWSPSDLQRKVEWLRKYVSSSVAMLMDAGMGAQVASALGLSAEHLTKLLVQLDQGSNHKGE